MGDLPIAEALKRAYEQNLDLVEIAPNATPPIAKIIDYGKFKYNQEKKEREHSKKQKETDWKILRIGLGTGAHDKEIKAKIALGFLGEGHKISIEMFLRGREKANKDFARRKFQEFLLLLGNDITLEQPIKNSPRGLLVVVSKKPAK